jgi:hypothetical protein
MEFEPDGAFSMIVLMVVQNPAGHAAWLDAFRNHIKLMLSF